MENTKQEVHTCEICEFDDEQEDMVETPRGWAHRICIAEQDEVMEPTVEENETTNDTEN